MFNNFTPIPVNFGKFDEKENKEVFRILPAYYSLNYNDKVSVLLNLKVWIDGELERMKLVKNWTKPAKKSKKKEN